MNGPWNYYAKWSESDGGRQIPYFSHMWILKKKRKTKQIQTIDIQRTDSGYQSRRGLGCGGNG